MVFNEFQGHNKMDEGRTWDFCKNYRINDIISSILGWRYLHFKDLVNKAQILNFYKDFIYKNFVMNFKISGFV